MDNYIYGKGHLSGDLKWRHANIWGIIIFPWCNSFHLSKSIFPGVKIYLTHLVSGSFCRQCLIILLNALLYFLNSSFVSAAVSKVGGSFCSVNIKTWEREEIGMVRRTMYTLSTWSRLGISGNVVPGTQILRAGTRVPNFPSYPYHKRINPNFSS